MDLARFATKPLGTPSGGERYRVMVARALAQVPELLVQGLCDHMVGHAGISGRKTLVAS